MSRFGYIQDYPDLLHYSDKHCAGYVLPTGKHQSGYDRHPRTGDSHLQTHDVPPGNIIESRGCSSSIRRKHMDTNHRKLNIDIVDLREPSDVG